MANRYLTAGLLISVSGLAIPGFGGFGAKTDREILERTSSAFNDVAKKATPAVVSISAIKNVTAANASELGEPLMMPPGKNQNPGAPASPFGGPRQAYGLGSGVIIRGDGVILTNNHVVENATRVTVSLDEDKNNKVKARVLGTDPKTDIAVIKLEGNFKNLPTVPFGDSNAIQVGDWAVAIGSPFGLSHTVTSGIISAKGRGHMGTLDNEDFIQTDAPINPGNSGGPLLNTRSEMIGLNAAIFSQSGGFIGIGFSIPSNLAKQISQEIIDHGHVVRGFLGVGAQDIDKDLAGYFKVPNSKGALVTNISPTGPASGSDIQVGDVIVNYNGQPINNSTDLKSQVAHTRTGALIPLQLYRDGRAKQVSLVVREMPQPPQASQTQQAGQLASGPTHPSFGVMIQDIPSELTSVLGVGPGSGALIVDVKPGSAAFEAGLTAGDVILKANDLKIRNADEFSKFAKKNEEKLAVLYVQRSPESRIFVPVRATSS